MRRSAGPATSGAARSSGVGLGALLILATKVGDAWLQVTVMAGPMVLDEYVQLADHALGSPSWATWAVRRRLGPVGYGDPPLGLHRTAGRGDRRWPLYQLPERLAVALPGAHVPVDRSDRSRSSTCCSPWWVRYSRSAPTGTGSRSATTGPTSCRHVDFAPGADAVRCGDAAQLHAEPAHGVGARAASSTPGRGAVVAALGGTFWLVCTLTATLGFGYHYGVDLVAGAVLCLTIDAALRDPERGWGWFRVRLVARRRAGAGRTAAVATATSPCRWRRYPELFGPLLARCPRRDGRGFYATFFARPDTALARWGGRREGSGHGTFWRLQFVDHQQPVLLALLAVGHPADAVRDDRRGEQGEHPDQDQHPDVDVAAQPEHRARSRTSTRPTTWGLVAACMRRRVSGKRTMPMAAVSASSEPHRMSVAPMTFSTVVTGRHSPGTGPPTPNR